jgi:putative hydrolases of HD superfamily
MDNDPLIDLFLEAATLKRLPRSGWVMRGVAHVESVADHSFGVAFMALVLAQALNASPSARLAADSGAGAPALDLEKVLVMAVLHDLAEVRLTDLPATAVRLIPKEVKSRAEAAAMAGLLAPLPGTASLVALWQEFEDQASPEGRLVRDADKLEMMVQCLRYEQAGSQGLDEFWQTMDLHPWFYDLSASLYARLKAFRPGSRAERGT